MSYIDQRTEDTWQKRLFDKLMTVESKLDHLLFLARAICRYDHSPSIETRILGHHRRFQDTQSGAEDHL